MSSPNWFNGKSINEVEFCTEFVLNRPLKCIGGKLYGIDGEVSDSEICHDISVMLTEFVTTGISRKVKSLLEALKLFCHSEPIPVLENEIHLLNGILKTDGTWISEKRFCVNRMNVFYNPEMQKENRYPDSFLNFLNELLDFEDMKTLQEYLGYCLIPSTKGQAMLFIIGNGGEGKSRIGVILQEIFKGAMVTGNFQRIETDRFFRYNLQNKLLMLDDDMQMSALSTTGIIKNLVTAEIPVDVEAKGFQSEQAVLYPRFICFGNGSPKALYDKSDGFARRLLILTTKQKPPNRIDDPYLAERFITEKEKIFCWMFEGLKRLINNNYKFTVSEKTRKNVSEAMADNCNIIEFLSDKGYIEFGTDFQESTTNLYSGYIDWCHKNLLTELKKDTFSSWLKANSEKYNIRFSTHIKTDNREVRGYKGIRSRFRNIILQ
ncbi:MAG: DNA primase [Oscillospiraceae bacterium]|nr:DNA primase [Oscillospiraceae bacterium]